MNRLIAALGLTLIASPVLAHPGHDFALVGGLLHPLAGIDHLAAMLIVGLGAFVLTPQRPWLAPVLFLAGLVGGALAARFGLVLPLFEPVILLSLLALGGIAAVGMIVPLPASLALLLVFGAAHGAAHAMEAPTSSFALYMTGFVAASSALHLAGLALAHTARRYGKTIALRLAGAAVALTGLALIAGA